MLRSGFIGIWVGVMPGTGMAMATALAYQQTVSTSKHPETFGKGDPEGVVAPEAANNAVQGGALVPSLTLGIPGSMTAAIFMTAMMMYGIRLGPQIFVQHGDLVWTIWWSMIFGAFAFILFTMLLCRYFVKVVQVPLRYLIPIVFALGIGGGYSAHANPLDVVAIVVFGGFAYFLERYDYPMVPLLVGFILGPLAETNFLRAIMISNGSYLVFFQGIINPILIALFVYSLCRISGVHGRQGRTGHAADAGVGHG